MTELRYLSDVVTLELDTEKCTGCGTCVTVCPHAVLAIEQGSARIVDRDACMECGACAGNCPAEALSVESGVGCAAAIIIGAIRGTSPNCACSTEGTSCCG
ncbi:MAG: 4Fe-4S binding protein [Candidatus Nealsonbacteria bacterium]|nr:4Fe-4S binding protein [Candidatus Nealsonbacteria bacterium]